MFKPNVGKLLKLSGEECETDQEISDMLNNFFASVFEKEGDKQLPDFPEQPFTTELENINITEESVYKIICQLSSKSQGPDNFHPKLMKEAANKMSKPLTLIFKTSVEVVQCGKK